MRTLTLTLPENEMEMVIDTFCNHVEQSLGMDNIEPSDAAAIKHILDVMVAVDDHGLEYREGIYEQLNSIKED